MHINRAKYIRYTCNSSSSQGSLSWFWPLNTCYNTPFDSFTPSRALHTVMPYLCITKRCMHMYSNNHLINFCDGCYQNRTIYCVNLIEPCIHRELITLHHHQIHSVHKQTFVTSFMQYFYCITLKIGGLSIWILWLISSSDTTNKTLHNTSRLSQIKGLWFCHNVNLQAYIQLNSARFN